MPSILKIYIKNSFDLSSNFNFICSNILDTQYKSTFQLLIDPRMKIPITYFCFVPRSICPRLIDLGLQKQFSTRIPASKDFCGIVYPFNSWVETSLAHATFSWSRLTCAMRPKLRYMHVSHAPVRRGSAVTRLTPETEMSLGQEVSIPIRIKFNFVS